VGLLDGFIFNTKNNPWCAVLQIWSFWWPGMGQVMAVQLVMWFESQPNNQTASGRSTRYREPASITFWACLCKLAGKMIQKWGGSAGSASAGVDTVTGIKFAPPT